MKQNELNLFEAVRSVITCDYCAIKVNGDTDTELAEYCHEKGWQVNRAGKVKCPKCVKKMKRKPSLFNQPRALMLKKKP